MKDVLTIVLNGAIQRWSRGLEAKDTRASAFQKKRSSKIFFRAISIKNLFQKIFSGAPQNFSNSKNSVDLEPRTGQFSRTY